RSSSPEGSEVPQVAQFVVPRCTSEDESGGIAGPVCVELISEVAPAQGERAPVHLPADCSVQRGKAVDLDGVGARGKEAAVVTQVGAQCQRQCGGAVVEAEVSEALRYVRRALAAAVGAAGFDQAAVVTVEQAAAEVQPQAA